MEGTLYTTGESILRRAQEIIGKELGEVDKTGRLNSGKGAIGTVIEESWFGYTPNSDSKPDFPEAGVELKVTPYLRTRQGIRAKERLVCNMINYMEEHTKTLWDSSFWEKCQTMLLMSYEHLIDVPKAKYKIDEAVLFQFPEEDLPIIERDWEIIMDKVRSGRAHEISEGDTLYLAACTKGANAASVRTQPFSETPAKTRAYSLKQSYMTSILNRFIFGSETSERIIKDPNLLTETSFEDYIIQKLSPYQGKTVNELKQLFSITTDSKNVNYILLARMLGLSGRIAATDEFKKANILPKTIRVNKRGRIAESMSFPVFDFIRISEEKTWLESEFYDYLAPLKFLFAIFKETPNGEFVFDRVQFWNMPAADLEELSKVWEATVQVIREGVQLTEKNGRIFNNLPKRKDSRIAHVRPHGRDSHDTLPLPDGRELCKHCFWLNNTYIEEQIGLR